MIRLELRLPFPPSANQAWHNRSGKGRGRFKSAEYTQWLKDAGWELEAQISDDAGRPVMDFPVKISVDLDDKRRGDCDNRLKMLLDLLVHHKVIQDDSKKWVRRVSIGWETLTGCRVVISEA